MEDIWLVTIVIVAISIIATAIALDGVNGKIKQLERVLDPTMRKNTLREHCNTRIDTKRWENSLSYDDWHRCTDREVENGIKDFLKYVAPFLEGPYKFKNSFCSMEWYIATDNLSYPAKLYGADAINILVPSNFKVFGKKSDWGHTNIYKINLEYYFGTCKGRLFQ